MGEGYANERLCFFFAISYAIVLEEEIVVGEALYVDLTCTIVEELLELVDPFARACGDEATTTLSELSHPGLLEFVAADVAAGALPEVVSITLLEGEGVDLVEDEDSGLLCTSVDLA